MGIKTILWRPIIVTDVKGMSEFVKDDFNGFTFKKNSVSDLTQIMKKIVDEPKLPKLMQRNQ